jgi:hypothetical protein
MKCALPGCGGVPTLLASEKAAPFFNLTTDGNDVYWFDSGRQAIVKCATGGCGGSPTPVISGGAVDIAVDGTNLYWTTGPSGEVRKCPLGDCCNGVAVIASKQGPQAYGLAITAGSVAWSIYDPNGGVWAANPK